MLLQHLLQQQEIFKVWNLLVLIFVFFADYSSILKSKKSQIK